MAQFAVLSGGCSLHVTQLFVSSFPVAYNTVLHSYFIKHCPLYLCLVYTGARSGAVGWGTALQAGRSRG